MNEITEEDYHNLVKEYFKNKIKTKHQKHCGCCIYLGTPSERRAKYKELKSIFEPSPTTTNNHS